MTQKSYHRTYYIHEIGFIEINRNHDNYVLDYVSCMSSTILCQFIVIKMISVFKLTLTSKDFIIRVS